MPSPKTTMRCECPVGYEPVNLEDSVNCPTVEDVLSDSDNSSLWLIKVPHDFDVSSLSGQEVILNGSQDLPNVVSKNKGKRYEVCSKTGGSAEAPYLSSFSVLLPSSHKKSLCAASRISGQMSIIRSVPVPPPTLPESSDSLTVQRQTHSKYIKKWVPFGCREPCRKSKEKNSKEPVENAGDATDGGRKKKRDRKTDREETSLADSEDNTRESGHDEGDDGKKKKKRDKERVALDLTRVKREPDLDSGLEVTTRKDEESSPTRRKRKPEMNGADKRKNREVMNGVSPTKKRKDVARETMEAVKVKRELSSPESSPNISREHREGDANTSGVRNSVNDPRHNGFDLTRVKSEPKETPKKSKKHRK